MSLFWTIIIVAISMRIISIIVQSKLRRKSPDRDQAESNFSINDYNQRWMFSQNEKPAYYEIKRIAEENELYVFAKVRLLDLVEPIKGKESYKSNLYKIQAKHVDFVLCNKNLIAKYIIELDDKSHDTQKRKERDIFVDEVLTNCGYKVLRTRYIREAVIREFISK